jgi:pre-rRNA-processing protein TSR1
VFVRVHFEKDARGGDGTVHRAGTLRQQNKTFKSKYASKGQQRRSAGHGRAAGGGRAQAAAAAAASQSKADRRNSAKQRRDTARARQQQESRRMGWRVPRLVAVVPLSPHADAAAVASALAAAGPGDGRPALGGRGVARVYPPRRYAAAYVACSRDAEDVLEAAKAADALVLVYAPSEAAFGGMETEATTAADGAPDAWALDDTSLVLLSLLKAQGLPPCLHVYQPAALRGSPRRLARFKRLMGRVVAFHFHESDRLLALADAADAEQLLRFLALSQPRPLSWRDGRPYLVADNVHYAADESLLRVTGYLRGGPLSADDLVHVPDHGDFQLRRILAVRDPLEPLAERHVGGLDVELGSEPIALSLPTDAQESLEASRVPDVSLNEQNIDVEDDDGQAAGDIRESLIVEERRKRHLEAERKRAGLTDQDAAWLRVVANDTEGDGNDAQHDVEGEDEDDRSSMDMDDFEGWDGDETGHGRARTGATNAAQEDLQFPDEKDTPIEELAKIRFARYRGLESFRHTKWDPMESLPLDYARVFHFDNYSRIQKQVLEERAGVEPGQYVTLEIAGVPAAVEPQLRALSRVLIISGLFAHEHKTSVVHVSLTKTDEAAEEVVRSKDPLLLSMGFRRFVARPVFSEDNPGLDKHKMERFLHPNRTIVASFYGPAMYGSCPVLAFHAPPRMSYLKPVAVGTLHSVNPHRVVVKKVVLTGVPIKVHKRKAVVKGMFHNADDVRWFTPVHLYTKYGHAGVVTEPLGTHGLMKCRFDAIVTNQDTVCMPLYKRVFPKWGTTVNLPDFVPEAPLDERDGAAANGAQASEPGVVRLTAANLARLQAQLDEEV